MEHFWYLTFIIDNVNHKHFITFELLKYSALHPRQSEHLQQSSVICIALLVTAAGVIKLASQKFHAFEYKIRL